MLLTHDKAEMSAQPNLRGWKSLGMPAEFKPITASNDLGWRAMEAAEFRQVPACDIDSSPCPYHRLILAIEPPHDLRMTFDDVRLDAAPPPGTLLFIPQGVPVRMRSSGCRVSLHVYLDPATVRNVASEAFGIDPRRLNLPAMAGIDCPMLRSAMLAVQAEMNAGPGGGGSLAAESLARVVAVQLIRRLISPCAPCAAKCNGKLPAEKLRAVTEFVMENLDRNISLEEMAAVAHLSPYHFSRQFKVTTGLPPHQFVIARRVERARQILGRNQEISLAEVALTAGFSDQSQFSHHFKRVMGLTPGQFRMSATFA